MKKNILFFSFLLFSCLFKSQTIYTFAGMANAIGYSGDGGPANAAMLNDNYGTAIDALGNVYIADTYNYRIRKVSTSGIITTIAGTGTMGYTGDGGPAVSAKIGTPYSITTDVLGNIYFGDGLYNVVRKINTSGIISTIAGGGSTLGDGGPATLAQVIDPASLAFDPVGNLFVSGQSGSGRIRKINTSGIISTAVGTGTTGFSGDGGPATAAQIGNFTRNGIAFDAAGNLYFTDFMNYRIRKVNTSGIISTIAGNGVSGFTGDGGLATAAQIGNANGLTADAAGNVYFYDGLNHIRKINTSGIISTIAGNGVAGWVGDGGPALSSEITCSYGLATDAAGNVYINDKSADRVRVICVGPCPFITGINSQEKETALSIYPNPSYGLFKLKMTEEISDAELVLYNSIGQKVLEQKLINGENNISTNNLPKGLYHFVVSQNNLQGKVGKIVVE